VNKKIDKDSRILLVYGFAPARSSFDIFVFGEFDDYANNQSADQVR
jgi:hypothetical protein